MFRQGQHISPPPWMRSLQSWASTAFTGLYSLMLRIVLETLAPKEGNPTEPCWNHPTKGELRFQLQYSRIPKKAIPQNVSVLY